MLAESGERRVEQAKLSHITQRLVVICARPHSAEIFWEQRERDRLPATARRKRNPIGRREGPTRSVVVDTKPWLQVWPAEVDDVDRDCSDPRVGVIATPLVVVPQSRHYAPLRIDRLLNVPGPGVQTPSKVGSARSDV